METGLSRSTARPGRFAEVLLAFLKLGATSFGGPVAHLGYFRREFVERRRWLDHDTFADLLALCQFLPGPASSQLGFSIGLVRAGWRGGLAAWLGFTLPSFLLMIAFAALAPRLGGTVGAGVIHGLKLVAVAVVAQAVWDMARRLCADRPRAAIAVVAIVLLGVLSGPYAQLIAIGVGALLGAVSCRARGGVEADAGVASRGEPPPAVARVQRRVGAIALGLFCVLLIRVPLSGQTAAAHAFALFDAFYRSGALVFGGGHVVLPLLQQRTVATGWVAPDSFFAGYGAAQALPGPLFSFAAYLGWVAQPEPHRWAGALLATVAIFLPGLLLVIAALPYWTALRRRPSMAAALAGVNAAVVGLLASALYSPVWTSAVLNGTDFVVAVVAFALLVRWKVAPLAVVVFCVAAGAIAG
ncbi:chromate efflux transporter [Paraburkholderia caballeronis]|uniref:Chromate transporter n=1 Tax=Paraburkholderia caballeronis TaxID=416943 RepID=A0A1H7P5S9_9BURK|nr:chromate efflux transporter [Paraburkholderia caballeronis]PXW25381.1 chromate transporter [Paraburkholderia caballeronis]PXX00988.1 chromate transporter [Paraburkholderia caballeronis]RAJ99659.1 chromate transporter [Paraburkholderia caballeronis]SEE39679.1 chromate transporter [Paraburkholderia caballeronis]SEL30804.1 chromate transporter [Paraburkholderia caballeronis]